MGWHDCPVPKTGFIHKGSKPLHRITSSGDHTVKFANGREWVFPTALAYYVFDCGYTPPAEFVEDVLTQSVTFYDPGWTRGLDGGHEVSSDSYTTEKGGSIAYLSQAEVDRAAENPWKQIAEFAVKLQQITQGDLNINPSLRGGKDSQPTPTVVPHDPGNDDELVWR